MRHVLSSLLASVMLLGGCSRQRAPDYEGMTGDMLVRALEALSEAPPADAIEALNRLRSMHVKEQFSDLALNHERERELTTGLNTFLLAGDLRGAERFLHSYSSFGPHAASVKRATKLVAAVSALHGYRSRDLTGVSSGEFAAALNELTAHLETLALSPAFNRFLIRENTALATLKKAEHDQTVRCLIMGLDQAIIQEPGRADLMLAQLAELAPDHGLVRIQEAVLRNDWRRVAELGQEQRRVLDTSAYIEMAFCLHWSDMPHDARRVFARSFAKASPESLCGMFFQARYAALQERYTEAVTLLRDLSTALEPTPEVAGAVMTEMVQTKDAFKQAAWVKPCPSVTDILQRVADLNSN